MQYVEKAELSVPIQKKSLVVNNLLKRLLEKHGRVTPQMIVDEAQNPAEEAHVCFEWDNTECGRKYRLMQATNMILASKFICQINEKKYAPAINGKGHMVRKLLPAYDGAGGFKGRAEVLDDTEARKSIVDRKLAVLRSWCESIVDISELQTVRNAILKIIPA
jgi:hypothetical protein